MIHRVCAVVYCRRCTRCIAVLRGRSRFLLVSVLSLFLLRCDRLRHQTVKKGKGSPYSTAERRVPELIPVLGSQPTGDLGQKHGSRLPILSARLAVTPATLKRAAAANFAAW